MIRQATTHDLNTVDAISVATIKAMQRSFVKQWQLSYPRKPHFQEDIRNQRLYVYEHAGEIVAFMALYKEDEESYKALDWTGDEALVVHRFMVDPSMRHKGIGNAMIAYAIQEMRTHGFDSLKIDTHPANTPMRTLLNNHQFQEVGFLHDIHRIAYERVNHRKAIKKIVILGSPGTGKTTLSRMLSQRLDLTPLHLDTVYWLRNWVALDPTTFTHQLRAFMKNHEQFVMDGNYMLTQSFEDRLRLCDTIILLNYPTNEALKGVIEREQKYKHTYRSDMATGCTEELDQEFLQYVATFDAKRKHLNGILNSLHQTKTILVFNSRQALHQWFETL